MLTHACELDQNHLFEKVIRKCRIWSSKGRVLTICRGNIVLKRWRENALVYFKLYTNYYVNVNLMAKL